jgi:hypothetical protein
LICPSNLAISMLEPPFLDLLGWEDAGRLTFRNVT